MAKILGVALLAACRAQAADIDSVFSTGEAGMHCGLDIDDSSGNELASLDTGIERAAARGEIVEYFGHVPGTTVPLSTIDHVLERATAAGLAFVTYADFAAGTAQRPGIALAFDDNGTDAWIEMEPLLATYGARVTFFVARYSLIDDAAHAQIRRLADAGHDIEAHTVRHLDAPTYVETHGLAAYLADEAIPSIEALRADGYSPVAFAYPFGRRTDELDAAISAHVTVLRSVAFSGWNDSPCPR